MDKTKDKIDRTLTVDNESIPLSTDNPTERELSINDNHSTPQPSNDLLTFLEQNKQKLELLLSGHLNGSPLLYNIKGKRSTKTIFFSEDLQRVMNDYCEETKTKQGDLVEIALVTYLTAKGYNEKLKDIILSPEAIITRE